MMQVTLNIDAAQLGDTVVDLFKNIPAEKKEEIAANILQKWLEQPYEIERKSYTENAKRKALEEVSASSYGYDKERYGTLEKIEGSDAFRRLMNQFKSSRETMIEAITTEATETYRKKVTELIQTDEQMQKMFEATRDVISEDFPKFVHDAMMYWFAQNMTNVFQAVPMAMAQSRMTAESVQKIKEKLQLY